ncbi:MAG: monoamine oxidase [Myxococcota bacterium]|jgi:monoamine oxidase
MNDVIVIGAGISGLIATRQLRSAGRQVVLMEGRARTGGRAVSLKIGDASFDLGPTWVWASETHVMALIQELGLPVFDGRKPGSDVYQTASGNQYGRLPRSAVAEHRIDGGTQRLADALAKTVGPVKLGCVAEAIIDHNTHLSVTTNQGTFFGKHVIAALPPRLLARSIRVEDPLTAMWRRVPTWMADVAKVVAIFDSPIWREAGLSGRAASTVGPMVEVHDLSSRDDAHTALFGFVPRTFADGDLKQRVGRQLHQMYGPQTTPSSVHIQKWWTEALTHSGDSETDDTSLMAHPSLHKSALGGRLHLTSCETSTVSPGHLNGAIERAQTVSKYLLSLL